MKAGLRACLGFLWAVLAAGAASAAPAVGPCSLTFVVSAYAAGLNQEAKGDRKGALVQWRPLAEQGFPPAQRRLAEHLLASADETGAAYWALAAAAGGDKAGAKLARTLKENLEWDVFVSIRKKVRARLPAYVDCLPGWPGTGTVDGPRSITLNGIKVTAHDRLDDEAVDFAFRRLAAVLALARKELPLAALVLPETKRIEILPGGTNNRYADWGDKGREDRNVLHITASSFHDKTSGFLARTIAWAAARHAAKHLPDMALEDPYVRRIGTMTLVGSVYPDVKNAPFFEAMARVLKMATQLPSDLRRVIETVDSVHYIPQSKHFIKSGPLDAVAGSYKSVLSSQGNRLIFVRRKMLWASNMGLLLLLLHEGTHVVQHETAIRYAADLQRLESELKKIPEHAPERAALKHKIAAKRKYVATWIGNEKDARGISKRMRFECEATENEIRAARLLGASPKLIERSQYLALCGKARSMMIEWREKRLRQGLERMNKR